LGLFESNRASWVFFKKDLKNKDLNEQFYSGQAKGKLPIGAKEAQPAERHATSTPTNLEGPAMTTAPNGAKRISVINTLAIQTTSELAVAAMR